MTRRTRGFTLFEVLVALAIMAVALAALLRASGVAADNSAALRSRMLAAWVAQNRLVLLRAAHVWPAVGTDAGEAEEDGRRWRWERVVSPTPNPSFRKVVVRVLAPQAQRYVLAEMTGYLKQEVNP
ncbi:type II secretion system minor pseudopilin GspI [Paludibacterium yongneupense]|uniref:type II secretion system minor pseudopilin GspI n=1 Tax=Paludibacterium yongneupense TaxID=400061 RepID=UPI000403D45C|nr:type II secretion system minor pseudopilin GspI [Paludibacterium yongneupense]